MATVPRQPITYVRRTQSGHAALHNLQNSESFQLPLQQNLPPGDQSFVNPTLRKRNPQDHKDSFKLPLQQNLPPGDQLTKHPPRGLSRVRQDWIQSSPTTLISPVVADDVLRIAKDWPVPRRQSRNIADWTNYILPWAQAPPQTNYDWPNPRVARRSPQDWLQSPFIPTIPPDEPAALPLMGQIWME